MIKFYKLLFSFGLILVVSFNSCKKKENPSPSPSSITTLQDTIFNDSFLNNNNNWYLHTSDTASSYLSSGNLFLSNGNIYNAIGYWKLIPLDQTKDFTITASITKTTPKDNYGYGVNWGQKDGHNLFEFLIEEYGYYKIDKWENGTETILANWTKSTAIGASYNVLQVSKQGSNLVFKINGNTVFTSPFQSFLGDNIGFTIDNQNDGIAIDYLLVTQ